MRSLITRSAKETRSAGALLAGLLRAGDVLLLTGDLGAGKSEFARGLAEGLGIAGPIPSPTFTLLNLYDQGTLPLKHFDWYRLSGAEEIEQAGLTEHIGGEGVTAIEWHERAPELLPEDCLEITLEGTEGRGRRLSFTPRGAFRALPYDILADGEGIARC